MLISLKANLALLALPKTGTTALESALRPHCDVVYSGDPRLKHINLRRFDRVFRPQLARIGAGDIDTFCMLREPMNWLESWYRYRARFNISDQIKSTANVSFEQFALAWLQDEPPEYARAGRQARFVQGEGGRQITHLYRYENYDAAIGFLETRFARKIVVDRVNISPQRATELSAETRAKVIAALAEDYALWESIAAVPA
jgi:hypothetical protein